MKGATAFSGIGAPECAAPWIDWRWCAEIEPYRAIGNSMAVPVLAWLLGRIRAQQEGSVG